jgi:hypothetical protein
MMEQDKVKFSRLRRTDYYKAMAMGITPAPIKIIDASVDPPKIIEYPDSRASGC